MNRPQVLAASMLLAASLLPTAQAGNPVEVFFPAPTLDRWMYGFNATPGTRPDAPTFGAVGFEDFDERDGQFLIGFATDSQIPSGLGPDRYRIIQATIMVTTMVTRQTDEFRYDPTADSYRTYLDPNHPDYLPDDDVGRPLELFGVGYRNGFTPLSFCENSPYSFVGPLGKRVRNAYAIDVINGSASDVSNNVVDEFEAVPWAVGVAPLPPGSPVPPETDFTFDLDLKRPEVVAYLRTALSLGRLNLMIATLHNATEQGGQGSSFPRFYTKENALSEFFDYEARLLMTVEILPDRVPAVLTGLNVTRGSLTTGGLADLRASDDQRVRTRSGFGSNFTDLHSLEMLVQARSDRTNPNSIVLRVESSISHDAGLARLRLRNWNANRFDTVAQYAIGQPEATFESALIPAAEYVNTAGDMELQIRHTVVVPVFAFRFDSFFDLVDISVD